MEATKQLSAVGTVKVGTLACNKILIYVFIFNLPFVFTQMCKSSSKFLIGCEGEDAYRGTIKDANKILVGKFEGKQQIWKPRRRRKFNFKI
jgi:hypothetical protein